MHIAPNAKCQRVLVFALWLVIDFNQVEADENKHYQAIVQVSVPTTTGPDM